MKNIFISFFVSLLIVMSGCHKPDELQPTTQSNGLNSISIQFATGEYNTDAGAVFTANIPESSGEIVVKVPFFYPTASDNVVSQETLKSMRVMANLEPNFSISPKLGTWDMTRSHEIEVIRGDGVKKKYTVRAEIYKLTDCSITEFNINNPEITGLIDDKNISLISVEPLVAATAMTTISPHATISPNPADAHDYSSPVKFTVTAHDGVTKAIYTVSKVVPPKIGYGFRAGSEKEIWKTIDLAKDHGIVNAGGKNYTLGALGNYLILSTGVDKYCFNRITGVKTGTLQMGGIVADGAVTTDAAGNLVLCTQSPTAATPFVVYTTNAFGTAPVELFRYTNATGASMGKKMSVQGDVKGNAVVTVPIYTWNGAVCKFVRWDITGGVVGAPVSVTVTGTASWNGNGHADVISAKATIADGYFMTLYSANAMYHIDGATNTVTHTVATSTWGGNSNYNAIDVKVFNNARYVAVYTGQHFTYGQSVTWMFDGTTLDEFKGKMDDSKAKVFVSGDYKNTDGTNLPQASSDVLLVPSTDGYKMHLYYTDGNGKTLVAWEFDCIDK